MNYLVDQALCCGHGQCELVAAAVFTVGDDGLNAHIGVLVPVPAGQEPAARAGAWGCPDAAIRLFEDDGRPVST